MNDSLKPKESIDTLMSRIESIAQSLSKGDASLESSLQQYEEGVKLAKECQKRLHQAEQRVTELRDLLESDSDEPNPSSSDISRID
ncbi:MAG: exodeoxyribonuclease VII small subunit [Bacteroidetes bacterium]|nr:exodeoxyribonuclease VII small subunit [Bacteroidota bacterium]